MDTNFRTAVKTFSYRCAAALSVFLAALVMGHGGAFGLNFVILSFTVGFVSFFLHERVWNMVRWGRNGIDDTRLRSAVKTITWRAWAFCVLFVTALILGLKSNDALAWSIVSNVLFIVVHYIHERVWNLVTWGKVAKPAEA